MVGGKKNNLIKNDILIVDKENTILLTKRDKLIIHINLVYLYNNKHLKIM